MFTGIIEQTGLIQRVEQSGTNRIFWVESALAGELKIDQSVSHNGVCLTIEEVGDMLHRVTAIEETLIKTNLGSWQPGTQVNLERCLSLNARLDGHLVQGHVDSVAKVTKIDKKEGSIEVTFKTKKKFAGLMIEKGSVSINGISLTIFNVCNSGFTVAVIPYTFEHTNMQTLQKGNEVNIEFDMIGKYVNRFMQLK